MQSQPIHAIYNAKYDSDSNSRKIIFNIWIQVEDQIQIFQIEHQVWDQIHMLKFKFNFKCKSKIKTSYKTK